MSDIPPDLTENIELHTKHFACPSSSAIANHSLNSFELNHHLLKEHVLFLFLFLRSDIIKNSQINEIK
jgi:hypothetical protein